MFGNKINRRAAGWLAQKEGKSSENKFEWYCNARASTSAVRIPDGCVQLGGGRMKRVKSPFDWVVGFGATVFFCDTKSTSAKSYSLNEGKIEHQLAMLEKLAGHNKAAGYLVEFRALGCYRWYSVQLIREILKKRKSLSCSEGKLVGSTSPMQIDFAGIVATIDDSTAPNGIAA